MSYPVKNSFLHFENTPAPKLRRCVSVPCLHIEEDDVEVDEKFLSPTTSVSTAASTLRLGSFDSNSGASSSAMRSPVFREVLRDQEGLTTIMIRNIPCKYKQSWLMEEVSFLAPNVDFLYMPPARRDGGSKGYAFVNFADEETAARFLAEFEGHTFYRQPNSLKKAQVGYAEVQGLVKNVKFYKRCKAIKTKFHPYINRAALKIANKK